MMLQASLPGTLTPFDFAQDRLIPAYNQQSVVGRNKRQRFRRNAKTKS
jgi:hypothetical protein